MWLKITLIYFILVFLVMLFIRYKLRNFGY